MLNFFQVESIDFDEKHPFYWSDFDKQTAYLHVLLKHIAIFGIAINYGMFYTPAMMMNTTQRP
jgi:hypothetical protein